MIDAREARCARDARRHGCSPSRLHPSGSARYLGASSSRRAEALRLPVRASSDVQRAGNADGRPDGHADGRADGDADGRADGCPDGRSDGRPDGHARNSERMTSEADPKHVNLNRKQVKCNFGKMICALI